MPNKKPNKQQIAAINDLNPHIIKEFARLHPEDQTRDFNHKKKTSQTLFKELQDVFQFSAKKALQQLSIFQSSSNNGGSARPNHNKSRGHASKSRGPASSSVRATSRNMPGPNGCSARAYSTGNSYPQYSTYDDTADESELDFSEFPSPRPQDQLRINSHPSNGNGYLLPPDDNNANDDMLDDAYNNDANNHNAVQAFADDQFVFRYFAYAPDAYDLKSYQSVRRLMKKTAIQEALAEATVEAINDPRLTKENIIIQLTTMSSEPVGQRAKKWPDLEFDDPKYDDKRAALVRTLRESVQSKVTNGLKQFNGGAIICIVDTEQCARGKRKKLQLSLHGSLKDVANKAEIEKLLTPMIRKAAKKQRFAMEHPIKTMNALCTSLDKRKELMEQVTNGEMTPVQCLQQMNQLFDRLDKDTSEDTQKTETREDEDGDVEM